ncbi:hypothetical protein ACVH9Z_20455 [Rhodococcus opacus]|uniref:DUF4267 domain-containing protein n=1 Tax=Rhodococcus opacus TaxID=37919 RepID=A0AAX3Y943_RHOOP|nr:MULTISPECIES: hypothetical protein [Rhodococcus]NHU41654.1 hypothetical protein [Rhodococcus sp. A14]MCZ4586208.1 hypothetical protein [Rhodococcus opacus]MDI9941551.1 hypothetical protein [Rhodococcus sp. IEGM 1351]MDJ0417984.1 hypothetical protein [Rhodococcus opacus]MDV6247602.1 hypothetical protein [Rhodococcus opacus]
MTATRARLIRFLGVTRATVGVAALVRPRLVYRCLGVSAGADGDTVARLFAIREVAVAAAALQPDPTGRRLGLAVGVIVDSVDAVSVAMGSRKGVSATGAVLVGGAAALYTVAGAYALIS